MNKENLFKKKITFNVEPIEEEGNEVKLAFTVVLDYIENQDLWTATTLDPVDHTISGVGRYTYEAILDVIANKLFNFEEEE